MNAGELLVALAEVARLLGDLHDRMVFVGGAVVPLLITDAASSSIRPTRDVDVVAEVTTRAGYAELEEALRERGFRNDRSEGAPICRWRTPAGTIVDVMPLEERILGFTNRWYRLALDMAVEDVLPSDVAIRRIAAAAFVATKLEAFRHRGGGDYLASHDLEDVIVVFDGRPELDDEVAALPPDARTFVGDALGQILSADAFLDALPWLIGYDAAAAARADLIEARLRRLVPRLR